MPRARAGLRTAPGRRLAAGHGWVVRTVRRAPAATTRARPTSTPIDSASGQGATTRCAEASGWRRQVARPRAVAEPAAKPRRPGRGLVVRDLDGRVVAHAPARRIESPDQVDVLAVRRAGSKARRPASAARRTTSAAVGTNATRPSGSPAPRRSPRSCKPQRGRDSGSRVAPGRRRPAARRRRPTGRRSGRRGASTQRGSPRSRCQ